MSHACEICGHPDWNFNMEFQGFGQAGALKYAHAECRVRRDRVARIAKLRRRVRWWRIAKLLAATI